MSDEYFFFSRKRGIVFRAYVNIELPQIYRMMERGKMCIRLSGT